MACTEFPIRVVGHPVPTTDRIKDPSLVRLRGAREWTRAPLWCIMEVTNNIYRARNLLMYMSEHEAARVLQDSGVSNENTFLYIKAAKTLLTLDAP